VVKPCNPFPALCLWYSVVSSIKKMFLGLILVESLVGRLCVLVNNKFGFMALVTGYVLFLLTPPYSHHTIIVNVSWKVVKPSSNWMTVWLGISYSLGENVCVAKHYLASIVFVLVSILYDILLLRMGMYGKI